MGSGPSGSDFFVSFDSDVVDFAGSINAQLTAATRSIQDFENALNGLDVNKLSTLGRTLPKPPPGAGMTTPSGGTTGGVDTSSVGKMNDAIAGVAKSIMSFEATLDTTLKQVIESLRQTSKAAQDFEVRSAAEQAKIRERRRVVDPQVYQTVGGYVAPPTAKRPIPRRGDVATGGIIAGTVPESEYVGKRGPRPTPTSTLVTAPEPVRQTRPAPGLMEAPKGKSESSEAASLGKADVAKISFKGLEKAIASGTEQTALVKVGVHEVKAAIDQLSAKLMTAGVATSATGATAGAVTATSAAAKTSAATTPKEQKLQGLMGKLAKAQAEREALAGDPTAQAAVDVQLESLINQISRAGMSPQEKRRAKAQRRIDTRQNRDQVGSPTAAVLRDLQLARTIAVPDDETTRDTPEGKAGRETRDKFGLRSDAVGAIEDPRLGLRGILDTFRQLGMDPSQILKGKQLAAYRRIWDAESGSYKAGALDHPVKDTKKTAGYLSMVGTLGQALNARKGGFAVPENATPDVKKMYDTINRSITRTKPAEMDDNVREFFQGMGVRQPQDVQDALDILRTNSMGGGSQRSVLPVNRPAGRGKVKWGSLWPTQGAAFGHGPVAGNPDQNLTGTGRPWEGTDNPSWWNPNPDAIGAEGPMSQSAPALAKARAEEWARGVRQRAMQMAQLQASGVRGGDERFTNPYRPDEDFVTGNDTQAREVRRGASTLRQAYDVLDADPLRYLDIQEAAQRARAKEAAAKNKKAAAAQAKKAQSLEDAALAMRLESPELYTEKNLTDVRTRQASRETFYAEKEARRLVAQEMRSKRTDVSEAMRSTFIGDLMPGTQLDSKGGIQLSRDLEALTRKTARRSLGAGATDAQVGEHIKGLTTPMSNAYKNLQKFILDPTDTEKFALPPELATGLDQFGALVDKTSRGKKLTKDESAQLGSWQKFIDRNDPTIAAGYLSPTQAAQSLQRRAQADPAALLEQARQQVTGSMLQTRFYDSYDRLMGPTGVGVRRHGEVGFGAPTYGVQAPIVRFPGVPGAQEMLDQGMSVDEVAEKLGVAPQSAHPFREASRSQYKQNAEQERKAAQEVMAARTKERNALMEAAGMNLKDVHRATMRDLAALEDDIVSTTGKGANKATVVEAESGRAKAVQKVAEERRAKAAEIEKAKALLATPAVQRPQAFAERDYHQGRADFYSQTEGGEGSLKKAAQHRAAAGAAERRATDADREQQKAFEADAAARKKAQSLLNPKLGDRATAGLTDIGMSLDEAARLSPEELKKRTSQATERRRMAAMTDRLQAYGVRFDGKVNPSMAKATTADELYAEFERLRASKDLMMSSDPHQAQRIPTERAGTANRVLTEGERPEASEKTGIYVDQDGNVVRTTGAMGNPKAPRGEGAGIGSGTGNLDLEVLRRTAGADAQLEEWSSPEAYAKARAAYTTEAAALAESQVQTSKAPVPLGTLREMEAKQEEALKAMGAKVPEKAASLDEAGQPVVTPTVPRPAVNAAASVAPGPHGKVDTDDDVAAINRVTAAINALHATIRSGVQVRTAAGTTAAAEQPLNRVLGRHRGRRGVGEVAADSGAADLAAAGTDSAGTLPEPRAPKPRRQAYKDVDRERLVAQLDTVRVGLAAEARAAIAAKDSSMALAVAQEAVAKGAHSAESAQRMFGDALKMTSKQAREFQTSVSQAVNAEKDLARASNVVSDGVRRKGEQDRAKAGAVANAADLSPKAHQLGKELGAMIGKSSQPEIRAKMEEVFRQVQSETEGMSRGRVRNKAQDLMGAYGFQPSGGEMKNLARSLSGEGGGTAEVQAAGRQVGGYYAASMSDGMAGTLQRSLFGAHGFWSRVMNSAGLFMVRNFAAGAVFGLTNALQEVISVALQTEATFVRVSKSLEATGRSADGLRTSLLLISTDYGVALKDVYTTAAGLTGVFESVEEIEGATRVVTQLQMISNGALNATEGMGALASASAAFGLYSVDSLQHVADVMTVIQQNLGTNLEISIEGLGSFAGQAVQLGLSLEEAAVYVSQIAKMTNSQGAAAGEQFGRILSVMQTGRGQSSLRDAFGADMGNALDTRDYSTALRILMSDYKGLTKAQQDSVATTLGGQRQMRALQALLLDGTKVLNTITKAEQAHGQAQEMAAEIANKLNVQFQKLRTNLQAFGMEIVRSGALNFLGVTLRAVNTTLTAVSTGISKMNDLIDKSPLLSTFRSWTGALLGMVVAMKLARTVAQSLKGSMLAMSTFVTAQGARAGLVGPGGVAAGAAGLGGLLPGVASARAPRWDRMLARGAFAGTEGVGVIRAGGMLNTDRRRRYADWRLAEGLVPFGPELPPRQNWAQRASGTWAERAAAVRAVRVPTSVVPATASLATVGSSIGQSAFTTGPRSLRLMEAGANGMSKALNGAGNAVALMTANAAALGAAGIAVVAVLAAVWTNAQRTKQVTEETTAEYDRIWGKDAGKTEAEIADERQKNSVGQLRADHLDKTQAIGMDRISGGTQGLWEGLKYYTTFGTLGRSRDDSRDRYYGDLNKDAPQQQEFFKLADSVGGVKTENGMTSDALTRMRADAAAGLINFEDVQKASDEVKKQTKAFADKIQNDPDLSAPQKQNLLAQVQDLEVRWDDNVKGVVEGFTGVRILTSDMLKSLQSMVSAASGSDSVALQEVAQGLKAMVGESGLQGDEKATMETAFGLGARTWTNPATGEIVGVTKRKERLAAALDTSKTLMDEAEAAYLNAVAGGDDAKIETAQSDFLSAISAYGQARQTYLDYTVQQAQQEATRLLFEGDYEGAASQYETGAAALREEAARLAAAGDTSGAADKTNQANQAAAQAGQARIRAVTSKLDVTRAGSRDSQQLAQLELEAAQAEVEFAVGAEAEAAAAAKLAGAQKGVADAATALADSYYTLSGSEVRSALGKAANAADQARNALKAAEDGKMGPDEINRRKAAVNDAENAVSDAAQAQTQANLERAASSKLNSVARSRAEVAKAMQAVAYAADQYGVGTTEWIQAMSALEGAQRGLVDSVYAQNEAMRQTRVTRVAPGDAVKVARVQLSNARASMREAARYGHASTQYQSALQAEINAERAVMMAKRAIIAARVGLRQAYAQAAGDTIAAANAGVALAKVQLATAKKNSGGKNSAEVINAKASLVSARAAARDAKLQWELDTIDFNKEMGKITGTEAVKALQEMLKAKNLTEQQRRDIMRKIKGLQDDIRSQLTGSGFNIPGEIKMPTAYQVRRSLAVDAAQGAIVKSVTDVRRMADIQAASMSASSVSVDASSSQAALVSAMQSVREAVLARGSQTVNQDVQITTNAPTTAIVRTIVTQVVEELKRQSISATRANTSTPRAIR